MPRSKEAIARAVKKYSKENIKTVSLRLHRTHDKDILDILEKQESKQGYIKDLIRKDIYERNNS